MLLNIHTYTTYPLADWFVLIVLLLFGCAPNDGKRAERPDGPDFPNCAGRVEMTDSLFVSNNFGGPIRSPITRLLLVDLREWPLAIFALTFKNDRVSMHVRTNPVPVSNL